MNEMKSLVQSRTFWSGVIGMSALMPGLSKYTAGFDPGAFAEAGGNTVALVSFLASIYFRTVATAKIR
jgi:hypothetical protein